MNKIKRNSGITAIELLVTLAVVAVIAVLALPNMKTFLDRNRVSALSHELVASLSLARSEAIKRNGNAYLCALDEANKTCRTGEGLRELNNGWLVYADCNGNGQYDKGLICDIDEDGTMDARELIRIRNAEQAKVSLLLNKDYVQFSRSGRALAMSISLKYDDKEAKKVKIAMTGRIQIEDL